MTIHAAKGLEFPIVVLSGMTLAAAAAARRAAAVDRRGGYAVKLTKTACRPTTSTTVAPVDEQMDELERRRLLYVAATRARDHLVVSLHRKEQLASDATPRLLADAGGATATGATSFDGPTSELASPLGRRRPPPPDAPRGRLAGGASSASARHLAGCTRDQRVRARGHRAGRRPRVRTRPSEPGAAKGAARPRAAAVVEGPLRLRDRPRGARRPADRRPRDRRRARRRGRRAVHRRRRRRARRRRAQRSCGRRSPPTSCGGPPRASTGARPTSARVQDDGTVLEGFVDLIFREDDGSLVDRRLQDRRDSRRARSARGRVLRAAARGLRASARGRDRCGGGVGAALPQPGGCRRVDDGPVVVSAAFGPSHALHRLAGQA